MKVMVTLQVEEAEMVAPQVLPEMVKSPESVPEIAMEPMVTGAVPMLETATDCGAPDEPSATLPHVRLRGAMRTP